MLNRPNTSPIKPAMPQSIKTAVTPIRPPEISPPIAPMQHPPMQHAPIQPPIYPPIPSPIQPIPQTIDIPSQTSSFDDDFAEMREEDLVNLIDTYSQEVPPKIVEPVHVPASVPASIPATGESQWERASLEREFEEMRGQVEQMQKAMQEEKRKFEVEKLKARDENELLKKEIRDQQLEKNRRAKKVDDFQVEKMRREITSLKHQIDFKISETSEIQMENADLRQELLRLQEENREILSRPPPTVPTVPTYIPTVPTTIPTSIPMGTITSSEAIAPSIRMDVEPSVPMGNFQVETPIIPQKKKRRIFVDSTSQVEIQSRSLGNLNSREVVLRLLGNSEGLLNLLQNPHEISESKEIPKKVDEISWKKGKKGKIDLNRSDDEDRAQRKKILRLQMEENVVQLKNIVGSLNYSEISMRNLIPIMHMFIENSENPNTTEDALQVLRILVEFSEECRIAFAGRPIEPSGSGHLFKSPRLQTSRSHVEISQDSNISPHASDVRTFAYLMEDIAHLMTHAKILKKVLQIFLALTRHFPPNLFSKFLPLIQNDGMSQLCDLKDADAETMHLIVDLFSDFIKNQTLLDAIQDPVRNCFAKFLRMISNVFQNSHFSARDVIWLRLKAVRNIAFVNFNYDEHGTKIIQVHSDSIIPMIISGLRLALDSTFNLNEDFMLNQQSEEMMLIQESIHLMHHMSRSCDIPSSVGKDRMTFLGVMTIIQNIQFPENTPQSMRQIAGMARMLRDYYTSDVDDNMMDDAVSQYQK
eukprot:TRINITY_DN7379_c0_g1_i2.p1 TRINITY_DN7379_c0_g1~~TRINITY_DN7379_c0_g1_i2.p1  ORF type:complete len:757 (+),score=278.09 TRINITY_DN7379_c0_g1_i2:229-2499(+)